MSLHYLVKDGSCISVTTRSSADADKPARRVQRSVKVTKHSTIPYVRHSFLLVWNSNFVFKRRHFPIFDFKTVVTLKSGSEFTQGHWKWYHSIDCYGFLLVCFSNVAPKTHRFWDIQLQKCHDLENLVIGTSRSLEMSPFDRAHATSYWCSIVTLSLRLAIFEIFDSDLETCVTGHSRSSEPTRIDPPRMISY